MTIPALDVCLSVCQNGGSSQDKHPLVTAGQGWVTRPGRHSLCSAPVPPPPQPLQTGTGFDHVPPKQPRMRLCPHYLGSAHLQTAKSSRSPPHPAMHKWYRGNEDGVQKMRKNLYSLRTHWRARMAGMRRLLSARACPELPQLLRRRLPVNTTSGATGGSTTEEGKDCVSSSREVSVGTETPVRSKYLSERQYRLLEVHVGQVTIMYVRAVQELIS